MPKAVARRRKGYEHGIEIREHRLIADEPPEDGGTDTGPKPTELLAAALASCTAITIEMYAARKEWELGQVEVSVDEEKAADGRTPRFVVEITVPEPLTQEQRERIEVIASKCPVHRALASGSVEVADTLASG